MRIGEVKNIIGKVLAENNTIRIDHEVVYGGQAYQVNNYRELIESLDILSAQSWSGVDYQPIQNIKIKYGIPKNPTVLTTEEFNQLNTYINAINSKVPLYYSILESFTEVQDEKTINIQLPPEIKSLSDLSGINKRLEDILKFLNVDGQFEFKGFDKGTDWYVVVTIGILSYQFTLACLKIAQEYLKARTEYFKSEKARISYEACLKDGEQFSQLGFEDHQKKWLEIFIAKEVKDAVGKIGMNGQSEPELCAKLVKATTNLIAELDKGTEFHLSLNPPAYAREQSGELLIDYKKIQALKPKKDTKPKELNEPILKKTDDQGV